MKVECPKGSVNRDCAEFKVRLRQLGQVLRRDTVIGVLIRWVENMARSR
ncbi:hypothetical protein LCGC14_2559100 [marine sediment metagenome]|uniref:Uncharacterized protein n=1 Tax=marine sediment metagenome TaxID=412755 RepID=A0A0F9AL31_9ZZZZ